MKTLLTNCRRYNTPFPTNAISPKEGIYKCTSCSTIVSVYDENEYKPDYNFNLAEGMRIEELSKSIRLSIAKPRFMSPYLSKKGSLPWIAVLIPTLFFTGCDVDINSLGFHGHRMLGVAALKAIATIFFCRLKRPLFESDLAEVESGCTE